jgi:4-diphosphocytidyl-2-C-methyl-D-erythritol kinase
MVILLSPMTTARTVAEIAPAKLNLALAVGSPDDTGLHPICSWMMTVGLEDELEVKRLEDDRLSRYAVLWHDEALRRPEIDWSITDDLAVRAHIALEGYAGARLPLQMKLEKRIPVGGGLGGGSSDAAAMLRAVNTLFDLDLTTPQLAAIGSTIGSDVAFLVHGGSAVVQGLGETVETHETAPRVDAVLVFPDASCPTGRVYGVFDELGGGELRSDAVAALIASGPTPDTLFNDLTAAAISVAPELGLLRHEVVTLAERPAHVSGSGSTLFVLCDDHMHATALAAAITEQLDVPALAVSNEKVADATTI